MSGGLIESVVLEASSTSPLRFEAFLVDVERLNLRLQRGPCNA
jgi:hypothetical protein